MLEDHNKKGWIELNDGVSYGWIGAPVGENSKPKRITKGLTLGGSTRGMQ